MGHNFYPGYSWWIHRRRSQSLGSSILFHVAGDRKDEACRTPPQSSKIPILNKRIAELVQDHKKTAGRRYLRDCGILCMKKKLWKVSQTRMFAEEILLGHVVFMNRKNLGFFMKMTKLRGPEWSSVVKYGSPDRFICGGKCFFVLSPGCYRLVPWEVSMWRSWPRKSASFLGKNLQGHEGVVSLFRQPGERTRWESKVYCSF